MYLCKRDGISMRCTLPENVEVVPGVAKINSNGTACFVNGQKKAVDSIILATGYVYSFPFLPEESGVRIEDGNRIANLYKHTFNCIHPSMMFIGMNFGYNPFQYVDYQVRWVVSVLTREKTLPSKEDMIKEDESWYQKRLREGLPPQLAGHYFGSCHGEMIDQMAQLGGNSPPEPVLKALFDEAIHQIENNIMHYKRGKYVILGKDKWSVQ